MLDFKVIIPALKKNVAFHDDLIKKLSGITLIQRAINKAFQLDINSKNIYLITDSEEIRLIGDRNNINTFWDANLVWDKKIYVDIVWEYFQKITSTSDYIIFLSPYSPLLSINLIKDALDDFYKSEEIALKPIKELKKHLFDNANQSSFEAIFGNNEDLSKIESKSFFLTKGSYFQNKYDKQISILEWPIQNDVIEIESHQDWWICEKLLNRKKIIFRIIGNTFVGMGHIYRAISIAHEITSHEVLFVCDTKSDIAVSVFKNFDYWLGVYDENIIIKNILKLKPDIVINDILSSHKSDVLPLKNKGIKVINFEDLGEGAKYTDLTINELYDKPVYSSNNTLWGHNYFFLRDEFNNAKVHSFSSDIKQILISFGGTDQHNLTSKAYHSIKNICSQNNIYIKIVTGPGYSEYEKLKTEIQNHSGVSLTRATGIISSIMEKSQIAIVANGRTVYELAHMNIPAIVVSQHKRENMHYFASEKNGFIDIGIYKSELFEELVLKNLKKLINNHDYRYECFNKLKQHSFSSNKNKIMMKIDELLN
jgi:spore coat polysaccharide biosynthesis predicted glycosyltransferase SpsG/CMP-N-acetylneuraminic acid synthetase